MSDAHDPDIDQLAERFRSVGAPDPRAWAESQIAENDPALSLFLFMRSLWPRTINRWREDTRWLDLYAGKDPAVKRMLDAVPDRDTLGRVTASIALDVVFDLLMRIDGASDLSGV